MNASVLAITHEADLRRASAAEYEALSVRSVASGDVPQLVPPTRSLTESVAGNPRASSIVWTSRTSCSDVFFSVGYPALVSPSAS